MVEPIPRLLDVPEGARFLGVSERGLYRLVATGEVPACRVGRQLRFDEQELRRVLRQDRRSA